jgi:parallel beta-helix repeat protein
VAVIEGNIFNGPRGINSEVLLTNDNTITNNTFNVAGGQRAIDLYEVTANSIQNNVFNADDSLGILVVTGGRGEAVLDNQISSNQFLGTNAAGILNSIVGKSVDASCNWWGAADGPSGVGDGSGSAATGEVEFEPWQSAVDGACAGYTSPVIRQRDDAVFGSFSDAIADPGTIDDDVLLGSSGTYEESFQVNKRLTIMGVGPDTIIEGNGFSGNGINIPSGQTDVTISNLRVQNFTGTCIRGGTGNNNTLIDSVEIANCDGPGNGGGIYFDGPVDNITITNSTITNANWRSIVIWNGFKTNITITDNIVTGNGGLCCGIELQDGTASGVTITGNVVTGHGDSGLGLTGLTGGAGPNLIANNTVTDNGRFGIEIKNPNGTAGIDENADGAIVVRDNIVALTGPVGDLRDLAGIAVFRRAVLPGNVDIPTGVIVRNNTVTGYNQASDSDGFGIVIEGTQMRVFDNNLEDNDVGLQRQSGHQPYPGDGDQGNLADEYFGRGNSPVVCAQVGVNTFTNNLIDERDVQQPGAEGPDPRVTNIDNSAFHCGIQSAVDADSTLAGHSLMIDPGVFAETVVVDKALSLIGDPSGVDRPVITWADSAAAGEETLIRVQSQDVTIDGFELLVDQTYVGEGVRTEGNASGLVVRNNRLVADPSNPNSLVSFGIRNAIAVNTIGRPGNVGGGFGPVLIDNNQIEAVPAGVGIAGFFRAGVAMDTSHGTISGNDIISSNHDVIARFTLGGNLVVSGNTSRGGGVQLAEYNATGPVNVIDNDFLPDPGFVAALGLGQSSLRLQNNPNNIVTTVSGNTFDGHAVAIRAENYPALDVAGNTFTPTDVSDYRHIMISNRVNVSNYIAPLELDIAIDDNLFNSSTASGVALWFDNNNCCENVGSGVTTAQFSDLRVGGVAPNSFDGGLTQYIVLDDTAGNIDTPSFAAETESQPFFADIDATGNFWDGVLGAEQSTAERNATRARIVDQFANAVLGEVILEDLDSLTVTLEGLQSAYARGANQSGSELARFIYDDTAENIEQIFNVFIILDDLGVPIATEVYDELFVGFASDPVDFIRGLSGTTIDNVRQPKTIDVQLLFELQSGAPVGTYELVLTSYDVTGVDPAQVSLGDALAGEYPSLSSASHMVTIMPGDVYVDDDFAGLNAGDPVTFNHPELPGPVDAVFGVDAFATVSNGLNAVFEGGLVLVAEGQYPDGDLTFDRSQRLIGAGADVTVLGAEEGNWPTGRLGDIVLESDNVEFANVQVHGYDSFRINSSLGGVENIVIRDSWLRMGNQHGLIVDGRNWRITENIIEDAGQVANPAASLGVLGGVLDGAEDILLRGNLIRSNGATGVYFTNGDNIVLLNNGIENNGAWGAVSDSTALMGYSRASSVPNAALEVRTGDSVLLCNRLFANADSSPSLMRASNSDSFVSLNAVFDGGQIENSGSGQLNAELNWWEQGASVIGDVNTDPELDSFDEFLDLCYPAITLELSSLLVDSSEPAVLTITVDKPAAIASGGFDLGLEGVTFDLSVPPGLDASVIGDSCGGAAIVPAGLELVDGALPSGTDSCQVELELVANANGSFLMESSEFFSLETGFGSTTEQIRLQVGEPNIDLQIVAGVDPSVPLDPGFAYFTATLSNQDPDPLPENIVFWIDVDSIAQAEFDAGFRLEWFNPDSMQWTELAWGVGRPEFPDREAFFLGRDGSGNVTGFPLGGSGDSDGQYETPIRANFDNDLYELTSSVESVDANRVYAMFMDQLGVISTPVDLDFELVRGVTAPDTPPRFDYFTATLTNHGGATPDNVVLYVEIDNTDFAAGDSLEFWNGTAWQSFGWDTGRQAWFLGRDGAGGVSGFPIDADQVFPIEIRVNFLPETYDFTISVESIDENIVGVAGVYAVFSESAEVLPTPATITFNAADLVQTFDGNVKTVGVTTAPEADLSVDISFDPEPPLNAGSYVVNAVITDPYFVGSAVTSLLIEKGEAVVTLSELTQVYAGGAELPVTVDTDPVGLTVIVTYDGMAAVPTDVGTYSVVATVSDANWAGSAAGILSITPATSQVVLDDLNQVYDGTPRVVSATTAPTGLTVNLSYDGSSAAPINAGSYAVTGTIDDSNYVGSATDTLNVAQAEVDEIVTGDLSQVYDGTAKQVSVTSVPADLGFGVTYDGSADLPVDAGTYAVVVTIDDQNYFGSASAELEIMQAEQVIDFPALPDRTVNDSPFTLSATASSSLPAGFELISGPATLAGNEVTLTGELGEVVIEASQDGDGNWLAADAVQRSFEVTEGAGVSIEAVSDTEISGQTGQPVAAEDRPTVRVLDEFDNPVSGVTVSFEVTSGGGSVSGATQVTDSAGHAQVGSWTLGADSIQTLIASAPGLSGSPVEFTATAEILVDLAILIDDNRETIEVGQRNTYVIVVSNVGPGDAMGVEVEVPLADELAETGSEWVCFPAGEATCISSGSGGIFESADLPAGTSMTFVLQADVQLGPTQTIVMTAELTPPAGVTDVSPETYSDSTVTQVIVTQDELFRDRFEPTFGPESGAERFDQVRSRVTGVLALDRQMRGDLPPAGMLVGHDRSGQVVFEILLLQHGELSLVRLQMRDAHGNWERSGWLNWDGGERALGFDYDADNGMLLLAGEEFSAMISTATGGQPVISITSDAGGQATLYVD